MPDQLFPNEFPQSGSPDFWGFDPVLVMVLSFIIVPVGLTVLVLIVGTVGRLLCGNAGSQSTVGPFRNRFDVLHRFQTETRFERRRFAASQVRPNAARHFHQTHRRGARRIRDRQLRRRARPESTGETMHGRVALKAYKRAPALENSSWYKGILLSRLAEPADNDGAFDLVVSAMREGTEPPPHVHSREDELFYVLSGELQAYVGGEVFTLAAGECIFLPRGIPHALIVASEEARMIALITPGGYVDAYNTMNTPAQRLEMPTDPDAVAHRKADVGEANKVFNQYGVRLLTPDEILTLMPRYPL